MIEFEVKDATCSHCVAAITRAVETVAPTAQVRVDLSVHVVSVDGTDDAAAVARAIREAGYTPVPRQGQG